MFERPPRPPNPAGQHFLHDRRVIAALVASAGLRPGDLVLDLGAGTGALTVALAGTGARVIAVERDPRLAGTLARRFGSTVAVRVVAGDIARIPLPHRPFRVVANPPFGATAIVLARLLDPRPSRLAGADLLVQWGVARRLTAVPPRSRRDLWRGARTEIRIVRRVPATAFTPVPSVAAAHVALRPRAVPGGARGTDLLGMLVDTAWAGRRASLRRVLADLAPAPALRAFCRERGVDPDSPATLVPSRLWIELVAWLQVRAIRPAPGRRAV